MEVGFGEALLYSGALLAIAAALSGVMRGTVLSIAVLSVGAGLILAETGAIHVHGSDTAVVNLFLLALIVTLFSDGLFVERELLVLHWGPVARALVFAMPLTLVLLALAAKLLFSELGWAEAFLLGSVLCATDPVVTSAVVTSQRVPASVRHALNLESGLNDGLALPFVLFFIILASPGGDAGSEVAKLLGEAAFGAVVGVLLGVGAGRLTRHIPGGGIVRRYEGIYALGVGLLAYGLADVTVGNGLIAAFVCGISLGVAEHDIADDFVVFAENVSSILQVLTFLAFGGLIVDAGFHGNVPLLIAFIAFALVVARPVAISLSFLKVRMPSAHRAFIAWFGPKGIAGILFAELVLNSDARNAHLIFETAAFVILASILAHGLTDTLGANWIERRMSRTAETGGR
ncbi:MAG TPA: cation:proton antiporter [Solirubrobacterales bacterium]|nr:cation:proton antiporter [Solirubrobacterales bacterium]